MRNVMVRCLFSVLILVSSHEFRINAQERHALQWSDQQLLADDWQPFIPNFAHERPYQQYPRSDTVRQFFGKNVEAVHNSLKKSFQTSAANNVDQYAIPPVLNTFNSFGLQTRPAILDKNIKDGQFLEQTSHFPLSKYQHQQLQQPQQQIHRFPTYIPSAAQYQTINQFPPYQSQSQYSNRYESGIKQPSLLQAPARTISTSVQVFPPSQNQQNHYPSNAATFFIPPPKNENFAEDEPVTRKQSRPNDFLVSSNIPTIYGTKDPALNIAPPALKATPYVRPEIQNHFLYEPVKATVPERFEISNYPKQGQHEVILPVKHVEHKLVDDLGPNKQQVYDQLNPSKQVFEQLSHYGRPFTLPKESVTEFSRLKPEKYSEPEGLIHSYSPPSGQHHHHHHHHHHHKKEKVKPTHLYMPLKNVGRIPTNGASGEANYPATSENLLVDYEPGKLQGVKTVTYTPEKDVIQFNEGDISRNPYQTSEKIVDVTPSPFLPTPTEPEESRPAYIHYEKYTTPNEELVSKLPQNHKYSGSRNRFHLASHPTESAIQYIDDRHQRTTTQSSISDNNEQYQQYETSTRKSSQRRRKPSKNKNKDYTRQKVNVYTEQTPSVDLYSSVDPVTESNYPTTRKKSHTKHTTTEATDDNYPNYPNFADFPSYVKSTPNYPKEYQYNQYNPAQTQNIQDQYHPSHTQYTQDQYQPPHTKYTPEDTNTEEKENYPVFSSSTTTQTPETTISSTTPSPASSLRPRLKPKYGNATRPRFSIKDYKRTTTASSLTTASPSSTENLYDFEPEKRNNRKNLFALRLKNRTESISTEREDSATTEFIRKFKPRIRPSKYKTSTTTVAPDTTSERVNTFKPSTIPRYRPSSTNKYFNRIRTTTEIVTNEADDAAVASSDKKPVRTVLYSAKRSSILKPKSTTTLQPKVQEYEDEEEDEYFENEAEESTSAAPNFKKNFQKYKNAATSKLEKADDASGTSIMTSAEEDSVKKKFKGNKSESSQDTVYVVGASASGGATGVGATGAGATGAEYDSNYQDEVLELRHENEPTTTTRTSTTRVPAATAEERIDDVGDRVSHVSSLTSIIDSSKLPASFYRKWSSTGNQNE